MQTFLPSRDFKEIANILDPKRLGKQRVETLQILKTLTLKSKAWEHHPAVLQWRDYIPCLKYYLNCMIDGWASRGYKNTMKHEKVDSFDYPHWLTDTLILSHKSRLLQKSDYYKQFNWNVPENLPYFWPYSFRNGAVVENSLEEFIKTNNVCLNR